MPADNSQTERLRRLRGINQALGPGRPSDQSTLLSKKFGQMEYTRQTPAGEAVTECCGSGESGTCSTVNFDVYDSVLPPDQHITFISFIDATHMKIRLGQLIEGILPFAYAKTANDIDQILRSGGVPVASNRIVVLNRKGTLILEKCGAFIVLAV